VLHRVHEAPDERRLRDYRANVLRQRVPCGDLRDRSEVMKLLDRLNGTLAGPALRVGFLKSLSRARYAIDPIGHWGLAKAKYAHFTSPIRRYADLMVHRSLLGGQRGPRGVLGDIAHHVSQSEHNSSSAERDSRNVKLFAFLEAQIRAGRPSRHAATVVDVRDFGFFVDVPALGIGGLVHVSTLTGERYEFDRERSELVARRGGGRIRLGDPVEVEVLAVDTRRRQVDFRLAAPSAAPRKRPAVRQPARA
jgi:ribonuclease R